MRNNDPYKTVIDEIRRLSTTDGVEIVSDKIVRIKTGDTITNEYLGFDGGEGEYFFIDDWYEGGDVELLGFVNIEDIDVPALTCR